MSTLIPAKTEATIAVLKQKWMAVGALFQADHPACNEECPYYRSIAEVHPYGSGTATEYLCDCTLGQRIGDKPESCPAYQQTLTESEEA